MKKRKPRVFVSVPDNRHLVGKRKGLKESILRFIAKQGFEVAGFEPEQFGVGLAPHREGWTVDRATTLIRQCDGVLILALARTCLEVPHQVYDGVKMVAMNTVLLPTPYNHLEGALAISHKLPLLILVEAGMDRAGIFASGIKPAIIPAGADKKWVDSPEFRGHVAAWDKAVRERRDVFLGYCSKADSAAVSIRDYLEDKGFSVLDWSRDFKSAGATILGEIERAASLCRCAVFLLTKDDEIEKKAKAKASFEAIPRDNVLLEAGYFTQARGKEHVAIVREKGAKMAADLGGIIYLSLENRKNLLPVKQGLVKFLKAAL
jgi:hypothetical protein